MGGRNIWKHSKRPKFSEVCEAQRQVLPHLITNLQIIFGGAYIRAASSLRIAFLLLDRRDMSYVLLHVHRVSTSQTKVVTL